MITPTKFKIPRRPSRPPSEHPPRLAPLYTAGLAFTFMAHIIAWLHAVKNVANCSGTAICVAMLSRVLLQRFRTAAAASVPVAAHAPQPLLLQPMRQLLFPQSLQRAPRLSCLPAINAFLPVVPPCSRFFASSAPSPPRLEQHLASSWGEQFVAAAPASLRPYLRLSR